MAAIFTFIVLLKFSMNFNANQNMHNFLTCRNLNLFVSANSVNHTNHNSGQENKTKKGDVRTFETKTALCLILVLSKSMDHLPRTNENWGKHTQIYSAAVVVFSYSRVVTNNYRIKKMSDRYDSLIQYERYRS